MQGKIIPVVNAADAPMVGQIGGWVVDFHPCIHTNQEVVESQSNACSDTSCNLLVETVQLELTTRLSAVIIQRPDITRIGENRTFKYPKQGAAILHIRLCQSRLSYLERKLRIGWKSVVRRLCFGWSSQRRQWFL